MRTLQAGAVWFVFSHLLQAFACELLLQCTIWYWPKYIRSRAYKYFRLVDPGSVQKSYRPVVDREERAESTRTVITYFAKPSIDRSVEVTTDVCFVFLFESVSVVSSTD